MAARKRIFKLKLSGEVTFHQYEYMGNFGDEEKRVKMFEVLLRGVLSRYEIKDLKNLKLEIVK